MLVRILCVIGLSLFGVGTVRAAEDSTAKVGFEYHAALTHDDAGLTKRTGTDPVKTTSIDLWNAKLNVEGMATKDVDYRFRYNMTGSALELGYANLKLNPMLSMLVGRYKVREGGYEGRESGYDTIASSDYMSVLPFALYSDMIQFQANMDFGTISLQLLNDRLDAAAITAGTAYNTSKKQPAMIAEWLGSFGDWRPLVQVGSYDMNHSMYFVVGVNGSISGLGLSLDYVNDTRAMKMGTKELKDTHTNINVGASYAMASFTPWLKVSNYSVAQAEDSTLGLKDAEGNTTPAAAGQEAFDDNGQVVQVGVNCTVFKEAYVPYAAVVMHSGTFLNPNGSADPMKKEELSSTMLQVGVHGKF